MSQFDANKNFAINHTQAFQSSPTVDISNGFRWWKLHFDECGIVNGNGFLHSKSRRSICPWFVVFRWSFASICRHVQSLSKLCIGINSHKFITSREDGHEIHSDLDSIDTSYPSLGAAPVCYWCCSLIFTDKERDDKERSIRFDLYISRLTRTATRSRPKRNWKRCKAFLVVVGATGISSVEVIVTIWVTTILKNRRYEHKLFGIIDFTQPSLTKINSIESYSCFSADLIGGSRCWYTTESLHWYLYVGLEIGTSVGIRSNWIFF